MVKVRLRLFTFLREALGKSMVELVFDSEPTVIEVLKAMDNKYGKAFSSHVFDEFGVLYDHINLLINGVSVTSLDGLKTKLKEGDTLAILPPVSGG